MGIAATDYQDFTSNEETFRDNEEQMLKGEEHRENYVPVTPFKGLLNYGERATNVWHNSIMLDFTDEIAAFKRRHNLINKTIHDYVDRQIERKKNKMKFRFAAIPEIVKTEVKIDGRQKLHDEVTHVLSEDYKAKIEKYKDFVESAAIEKVPLDKKEAQRE